MSISEYFRKLWNEGFERVLLKELRAEAISRKGHIYFKTFIAPDARKDYYADVRYWPLRERPWEGIEAEITDKYLRGIYAQVIERFGKESFYYLLDIMAKFSFDVKRMKDFADALGAYRKVKMKTVLPPQLTPKEVKSYVKNLDRFLKRLERERRKR